ncbi:hypothetical protein Sru01_19440 [Sphaerisporangium rufum]|uniref:DUF397 domain-containing protein n=1 Tax=Sphaerisporangium rufum TaxID=1381558 RepID=A0A919V035_9ACTN|nr:DUF397 domain-containing protein [Sphaerisporangium rufum]GII76962.1 hypothetical protein Sru01_19440 [Sphaerisporangium rufum]
MDLSTAVWRKSSRSSDNGGQCVEVATNMSKAVAVRDSRNPAGPAVVVGAVEWGAFLRGVRNGQL